MRVLFLLTEGSQLLDVAGPAQVVDTARLLGADYDIHFTGVARRRATKFGLEYANIEPLPKPAAGDWIVVSGLGIFDPVTRKVCVRSPYVSPRECDWLRQAHRVGARISSVCSGAFALGEAGILDNRSPTSHWLAIDQFRARFPLTKVIENVLFVDDGQVITSAGASAGIDMALHLVERDHGARMAMNIVRGLVLYQRRSSADAQLSAQLSHRTHLHAGIHRVQDWLASHAEEHASLSDLARVARMSVRSLTREFRAATGLTIVEFRETLRLEQAQTLAERPELSLEEVAWRSGFGGSRQLRRVWRKHRGADPIRPWRIRQVAK